MVSSISSTCSLNLLPKPTSCTLTDPNSNPRKAQFIKNNLIPQSNLHQNNHNQTDKHSSDDGIESDVSDSQPIRKVKPSTQLKRWSRARSIRSGRRFDLPTQLTSTESINTTTNDVNSKNDQNSISSSSSTASSMVERSDSEDEMMQGKSIYMVSDGTGWTAEHSVGAALGQFEHCLVDRNCAVNTHLFSGIDDVERLMEIIKQAAKEGAMVVYTLADPAMAESAKQACNVWGIQSTDILSPITEAIAAHLGVSPSGIPRGAPGHSVPLSDEYFKRIEAIEFTIKQDDGALPQNLHKADIVLAGVSRTGKTPLSIYLAQKGYKVANVPIVMGIELPKTLFEVDRRKIFGLTINPFNLQTIRRTRAKTLGFVDTMTGNYSDMDHVRQELETAGKIFAQNPTWPVIEVTGKAIEETAAVLLRLYHDRKQKCSMPRISKRY
ncbi:hypothetical protein MKW94_014576 [Papaver nudicaule]|uniref:Uncharacterized protein n=1 Tax=Papaver nudicaule TaxID=74823 RepID=A0AA41VNB6_PAPNU|nr:hypothetical protein [Papaver nudicaule]